MYCQHCKAYVHDSMLSHHRCPKPDPIDDDSPDLLSTALAVVAVETLLDSGSDFSSSTPDPDTFSGGGGDFGGGGSDGSW